MSRSINDMIGEIQSSIKKYYQKPEWVSILNQVNAIFHDLNGHGVTGKSFDQYNIDELTNYSGTLAVLRANLVDMRYECNASWKKAKAVIDAMKHNNRQAVKKGFDSQELKYTVKDIDCRLDQTMAEYVLTADLHETQYSYLQDIWFGIDKLCHSIETRINYLKGDYSTSKFYGGTGLLGQVDSSNTIEDIYEEPSKETKEELEVIPSMSFTQAFSKI